MKLLKKSPYKLQIRDSVVQFDYPILDFGSVDSLVIVVVDETVEDLESVDESVRGRNVLAFDGDGNLEWRIAPTPDGEVDKPYTVISIRDGALFAKNYNGYEYEVDLETGDVDRGERVAW